MAGATVRAKGRTRRAWISSRHGELLSLCQPNTGVSGNLREVGYGAGRATAHGRLKEN